MKKLLWSVKVVGMWSVRCLYCMLSVCGRYVVSMWLVCCWYCMLSVCGRCCMLSTDGNLESVATWQRELGHRFPAPAGLCNTYYAPINLKHPPFYSITQKMATRVGHLNRFWGLGEGNLTAENQKSQMPGGGDVDVSN